MGNHGEEIKTSHTKTWQKGRGGNSRLVRNMILSLHLSLSLRGDHHSRGWHWGRTCVSFDFLLFYFLLLSEWACTARQRFKSERKSEGYFKESAAVLYKWKDIAAVINVFLLCSHSCLAILFIAFSLSSALYSVLWHPFLSFVSCGSVWFPSCYRRKTLPGCIIMMNVYVHFHFIYIV